MNSTYVAIYLGCQFYCASAWNAKTTRRLPLFPISHLPYSYIPLGAPAMSVGSLQSALALTSLLSLASGSAPGDEHDYCVNTVNVEDPPPAREAGRNILLDTYNYAALLARVSSFDNPVLETFPPVFQRFDVDSSDPTLVSFLPFHIQVRRNYPLCRLVIYMYIVR